QSKIILLHFYSLVTSLLFDNMFPEFTLFSSLFYRFLIRNWGLSLSILILSHPDFYEKSYNLSHTLKLLNRS
ncbi:MAG: hypothetical protein ACR5LA_10685, partial [Wolbachia sp.]